MSNPRITIALILAALALAACTQHYTPRVYPAVPPRSSEPSPPPHPLPAPPQPRL